LVWQDHLALAKRQVGTAWYAAIVQIMLFVLADLMRLSVGAMTLPDLVLTAIFAIVAGTQAAGVARYQLTSARLLCVNGLLWTFASYLGSRYLPFLLGGLLFVACYARGLLGVRTYLRVRAQRASVGAELWSP
jgi:hypothetical protein